MKLSKKIGRGTDDRMIYMYANDQNTTIVKFDFSTGTTAKE